MMEEDYARAERFLPWNAATLVVGAEVQPHWIDEEDRFWYRTTTREGVEFVRVDPDRGAREPAFDHGRLAASLSVAAGIPYAPQQLPFEEIAFVDGGRAVRFTVEGTSWTCDLATYACAHGGGVGEPAADVVRSPDGQWEVFARDHNLWLRSVVTGEERALTEDGEAEHGYGLPLPSPLVAAGLGEPEKPAAIWSPDSTRVLSCRIDQRHAPRLYLVQSVPRDGGIRPRLHSYAYPLPGDEAVPTAEVWCFAVSAPAGVKAAIEPLPMLYHGSPLRPGSVWWSEDGGRGFLLTRDRGFQGYRLTEVDLRTGAARLVVEECGERGIDPYLQADPNIRVIADGAEVIWYSQRDGWGHLYLVDGRSGAIDLQITAGAYNVSEILHVDEAGRRLFLTAVGREPDRDPYYAHLYQVSLDGGEPELLTPEDADHTVTFSPSGRFFVDTFSRVDLPPVSLLRASAGTEVCQLERADVEPLLATGWQYPERFRAKARDGMTDVYGVIFRPSRFDPERRYPVIDNIYGGPQVSIAPTSFADAARPGRGRGFWHAQALAELGFVVVMVDGLGMPGRSKAQHDVSYRNLGDGGIADHIAALRQLGDRYPHFDLNRVGIYGHSAGGYASAHAILAYPEFFKVCVSSAGNHDHRLDKASWVERYMGLAVGEHYREQANQSLAHRLTGKLLLIHGEMDENVHPASTLALVDALIEANKDFDLLIMPNRPHACGDDPYFIRKRWDYFVTHLFGAEPPRGYRIAGKGRAEPGSLGGWDRRGEGCPG
ncbi:MAG: DPP IV N-terminal domain-containing protein [Thermomicrobiales bacterium]